MQIDTTSQHASLILEKPYDCIWVRLRPRSQQAPLQGEVLEWIDWKLQGTLSRFTIAPPVAKTTFVPSRERLAASLLALEWAGPSPSWAHFSKNCEGNRIKSLLVLCEDPDDLVAVRAVVNARPSDTLNVVVCATSTMAGLA